LRRIIDLCVTDAVFPGQSDLDKERELFLVNVVEPLEELCKQQPREEGGSWKIIDAYKKFGLFISTPQSTPGDLTSHPTFTSIVPSHEDSNPLPNLPDALPLPIAPPDIQ
jgi:hypothetical protein